MLMMMRLIKAALCIQACQTAPRVNCRQFEGGSTSGKGPHYFTPFRHSSKIIRLGIIQRPIIRGKDKDEFELGSTSGKGPHQFFYPLHHSSSIIPNFFRPGPGLLNF